MRSPGRTAVTLTKAVPARLATSLGLAPADQQPGAVLSLPVGDARALVQAGVGQFGLTATVGGPRASGTSTVTLTVDVPARLAASLGLASTDQQAGDVLSLPHRDAAALVEAGVARFGSTTQDAATPSTTAGGFSATEMTQLRAALVPFWTPNETVTAGAVRMTALGLTITRNSSGTTRPAYDATEAALWTVASGSGGGAVTPASIGAESRTWDQSRVPSPVGSMISKGAILTLGTTGQFDAGYLESPSVFSDPATGLLTMVYVGYTLPTGDPATVASVGYATSPDGITWTKQGQLFTGSGVGGAPDQSGATAPVMVTDSAGVYHLFYLGLTAAGYEGGGPSGVGGICHATATSLAGPWTRRGAVIQKSGTSANSWRWYGVWHPNLVYANGKWYLFFNASGNDGQGHTNVETIGYATATSLSGPWTVDDVGSPVIRGFNAADQVIGDPFVWREGDHWRMDMYRADSTGTTIGAYYATTTDALFPLGWVHRGQVTSAAANQGAKPYAIRFNGSVYYYASYGVNIFLNIAPDLTTRDQTVTGTWRFGPDRTASGRASTMVGDDINLTLGTGTKSLMVGGSASNSYLVLGQSNSRNLLTYWQYSATASAAIAKMETFGGSNQLNIQQNTGSLMIGGSGGKVGFYGITPVSKPALTYSRATENAADTALRTALVALGLVTDSTTA